MSMAGRACLVNTVIIPSFIHIMKVYLWPSSILLLVEKAMRNFIWTGSTSTKGKLNVCWSKVCAPYAEGGYGVTSITTLNGSILLKSLWDIMCSHDEGNYFIKTRLINKHNNVRGYHIPSSIISGVRLFWPYIQDNSRWICGVPSGVSF